MHEEVKWGWHSAFSGRLYLPLRVSSRQRHAIFGIVVLAALAMAIPSRGQQADDQLLLGQFAQSQGQRSPNGGSAPNQASPANPYLPLCVDEFGNQTECF